MATKISELPTGQKVGNILDETLQVGSAATTATTANVTIPRASATTNTVEPLLALNRQSSGTPANGIGASLVFDVETTVGNTERGATIEAVTTDVTAASEDFDLVFKTMAAGATAVERFRMTSTFGLQAGSDGSQTVTSFGRAANPNTGMYFPGGNNVGFSANGSVVVSMSSTGVQWQAAQVHQGIRRAVRISTAGSGAPAGLDAANDGFGVMTNEGSTAENYRTLPTAAAGYHFEFVVQDANGIRITAAAGDTIRDLATVSAAAGFIRSTTIGSTLRLQSINATEWVVMSKQGTWTIDS